MKLRTLISRLVSITMLSATLGSTAYTQNADTMVLQVRQFDALVQDLEINQKENAAYHNGFDSLRVWYNELIAKYEQSQRNLAACLQERDTAHAYITNLRTQILRIGQERDAAIINAVEANNKKKKAFGVGLHAGYDLFRRQPVFSVGLNWSLIRFSLRGLFDSDTKAPVYTPTIYSTLNH